MGFFRHIKLLDQIFEVVLMEAGHRKVVAVEVKIRQKVFQNLKVPFAGDLVQGHVDHLFLGLVPDVQNDDLGFFDAHVHHHGAPLVSFDDGAIVIYDDGVSVAQPLNAGLYILILRVSRGQGFSGVVGGRNKVGQPTLFHPHGVGLLHGFHLLYGVCVTKRPEKIDSRRKILRAFLAPQWKFLPVVPTNGIGGLRRKK